MFQFLKQPKILIWAMILILAAGWRLGTLPCFAGDAEKEAVQIKQIQPPPELNNVENLPIATQEMPDEPHYFLTGTVDAIGDDWITINDHQLVIAPGVRLSCSVGSFVGIQVNDERQVISCERLSKSKR